VFLDFLCFFECLVFLCCDSDDVVCDEEVDGDRCFRFCFVGGILFRSLDLLSLMSTLMMDCGVEMVTGSFNCCGGMKSCGMVGVVSFGAVDGLLGI